MGREDQIINERKKKLDELRQNKIDPYPHNFDKKDSCFKCSKAKIGTKVKTAGRILTKRDLGKIIFSKLRDESGEIQIVLQDEETPENKKIFFKKYVDSGDFVGIEGEIIKSKTGEISILVKNLTLLSKSLLPLPEKWHGIKDEEERFRKRYLDILMNPETKELFVKKSKFWNVMRTFLIKKG
jgi:lysyl-tRNA synthetase, class II